MVPIKIKFQTHRGKRHKTILLVNSKYRVYTKKAIKEWWTGGWWKADSAPTCQQSFSLLLNGPPGHWELQTWPIGSLMGTCKYEWMPSKTSSASQCIIQVIYKSIGNNILNWGLWMGFLAVFCFFTEEMIHLMRLSTEGWYAHISTHFIKFTFKLLKFISRPT